MKKYLLVFFALLFSFSRGERGVLCNEEEEEEGMKKTKILFLVGAQESGIEIVSKIINKIPDYEEAPLELIKNLATIWEITTDETLRDEAKKNAVEILQRMKEDKKNYFIQSEKYHEINSDGNLLFSYPFENPLNTLRRPDIVELFEMLKDLFNFKFLVTVRDPKTNVVSFISKGAFKEKECLEQGRPKREMFLSPLSSACGYSSYFSRVLEDILVFINSQIQLFSSELYRVIQYEELVQDPNSFIDPLCNFLEISSSTRDDLKNNKIIESCVKEDPRVGIDFQSSKVLNENQKKMVQYILKREKSLQWNFLYRSQLNLKLFDENMKNPLQKEENCVVDY